MLTTTKRALLRGLMGAACALTVLPAMAQDKPVIGIAVADQKSLFYVAALDGMKAAAEAAGYEVSVAVANNDSQGQVNQVENLLVQNIGALVFISQDSTAAAAGVKAANKAGVPVIAVDQRPESGQGQLATYIATDSVKAARDLCTWMFEKMGGKGKIAILHGVLGSTAEIQRTQGCQAGRGPPPAAGLTKSWLGSHGADVLIAGTALRTTGKIPCFEGARACSSLGPSPTPAKATP